MEDIKINQSAFAKKVGVSRQRIGILVKHGVLKLDDKKKLNLKESLEIYEKHKDPARDAQRESNAKKKKSLNLFDDEMKPEVSLADLSEEDRKIYDDAKKREIEETKKAAQELKESTGIDMNLGDAEGMTLNEAKTVREHYQGLLAKINYEKEKKQLIEISEVEKEAFEIARSVRDSMLSVPARVASEVAGMNDVQDISRFITKEIHYALEGLTK
ncbi:MAG: hypothetical protein WA945_10215 [Arcobacteraceae bacterium]